MVGGSGESLEDKGSRCEVTSKRNRGRVRGWCRDVMDRDGLGHMEVESATQFEHRASATFTVGQFVDNLLPLGWATAKEWMDGYS